MILVRRVLWCLLGGRALWCLFAVCFLARLGVALVLALSELSCLQLGGRFGTRLAGALLGFGACLAGPFVLAAWRALWYLVGGCSGGFLSRAFVLAWAGLSCSQLGWRFGAFLAGAFVLALLGLSGLVGRCFGTCPASVVPLAWWVRSYLQLGGRFLACSCSLGAFAPAWLGLSCLARGRFGTCSAGALVLAWWVFSGLFGCGFLACLGGALFGLDCSGVASCLKLGGRFGV
jgi:hypothetical protein